MQEPDNAWKSASYLKNVKQRDFESLPFEVFSDEKGKLTMINKPDASVTLSCKSAGAKADKDGRGEEAAELIRSNPTLSITKLVELLADHGIKRKKTWVGDKRAEINKTGVKSSASR